MTDRMPQHTLRTDELPKWREVWAASFPQHRLSINAWLCAIIENTLAPYEGVTE